MNTITRTQAIALVVAVIIIVLIIMQGFKQGSNAPGNLVATVSYSCNAGKTITAKYYEGVSKPAVTPDQPPTPGGSVALTLSDGRMMTLAQTISADGTRYANKDESFVFWSKGNGALVLENNQEKSFIGCIKVSDNVGGNLPQVYQNSGRGFSLRYPVGYTVNENYTYQGASPIQGLGGVKFTIPASMATGTNLSSDTYISVETVPKAQACGAGLFLDTGPVRIMTDQGTTYSVASSTDAAAGNRYEESVYALPGTNPCIAVRYLIHYGVIQNYPVGAVKEFDRQALLAQFDAIRRSLTIVQ